MPATEYKLWRVGNNVGDGVMQSLHVGVAGVAKPVQAGHPFAVANELICGYLARAVLLPIPPNFIVQHNNQPHHVSLNFNLAGQDLPPASPQTILNKHPKLACGITTFDIWVANADRHRKNIHYDAVGDKLHIFDHSHALCRGASVSDLQQKAKSLSIGNHCLAPYIDNQAYMIEWISRINQIPEFYVAEVIDSAIEVGLPQSDATTCTDFLLQRRQDLETLITGDLGSFPKLAWT